MAIQHLKVAKESGQGLTTSVASGNIDIFISSPAFKGILPSYLSFTKLGLIVQYTMFCTGSSTSAGGGSAEIHYEYTGSAWKTTAILNASVSGMLTGVTHYGYSSTTSSTSNIYTRFAFVQSTAMVINYAWIADIYAIYSA